MAPEAEREHIEETKTPDRFACAEVSPTAILVSEPPLSTAPLARVSEPPLEKPNMDSESEAEKNTNSQKKRQSESESSDPKVAPMYGVKMKLSKDQIKDLLSVVGNHAVPEHEWVRACHLLGDYSHNPTKSSKTRLIGLTASALVVLCVGIPWYSNYVQSHQSPDIPIPPPPIATVDFTPYMNYMEQRIKGNWFPPRGYETNRVVVEYQLSREGQMSNLHLATSSGIALSDQAALKAIENSAPFAPLPAGVSDVTPVQFTFDYNAFHHGPSPAPPIESGQPTPEGAG